MPTDAPPTSACADVTKDYRVDRRATPALRGVSKDFPAGRLTVVAGPSGCGKSTLLRLLACVDRPTSGTVTIAGTSVGDLSTRARRRIRRRQVGYLFPDPIENLVEYLTAAEQVRLAAQLRGVRLGADEIATVLGRLGLDHRLDHRPRELSGGEQQRISIACALAARPALVVADEPTAEVDSHAAARILDDVALHCADGAAFVIASHDPQVIERADHLLRLDHGTVAQSW
jgi:ABC-type lipoprotein export system ATPase subunit